MIVRETAALQRELKTQNSLYQKLNQFTLTHSTGGMHTYVQHNSYRQHLNIGPRSERFFMKIAERTGAHV